MGHTDEIRTITFDPVENHLISGAWDRQILGFSIPPAHPDRSEPIFRLTGHTDGITNLVAFSYPFGLLSTSKDGTIKSWNPPGEQPIYSSKIRAGKIFACGLNSKDNLLATGGEEKSIQIWRILPELERRTEKMELIREVAGYQAPIHRILYHSITDQWISVGDEVAIYSLPKLGDQPPKILGKHAKRVFAIIQIPNTPRIATAAEDKTIKIWDLQTHTTRSIQIPKSCAELTFHPPTEKIFGVTTHNHLYIIDEKDGRLESDICLPEGKLSVLSGSPTGNWLAIAPFGTTSKCIHLWRFIQS